MGTKPRKGVRRQKNHGTRNRSSGLWLGALLARAGRLHAEPPSELLKQAFLVDCPKVIFRKKTAHLWLRFALKQASCGLEAALTNASLDPLKGCRSSACVSAAKAGPPCATRHERPPAVRRSRWASEGATAKYHRISPVCP